MSKIRKLPTEVVAQIAAGQVVERPSSIVKELVENSLDAGAKSIVIKLTDGGRQEIIVTDDGVGMNEDDVLLSVASHSTSKIKSLSDLSSVVSFGFRGEALASIGLAANLVVQSKEADAPLGFMVQMKHGKLIDQHQVGMAAGTTVKVTELFKFLPARKKFLKSSQIELQQVIKVLVPIILSQLPVRFRLEHNRSVVFDCAANQTFQERVALLIDQQYQAKLLGVQHSQAGYTVKGFVGTPQIASSSRSKQYFWVNGRAVQFSALQRIVKSLYGTLLEPKAQPVFFLQLQADPQTIDINVHPQKAVIAFAEEEVVINILTAAIGQTLDHHGLGYSVADTYEQSSLVFQDSKMDPVLAKALKKTTEPWSVKNLEVSATTKIFQLHKLYLIVEVEDGMLLIDQHAAHERILYEQFLHAYRQHIKLHQINLEKPQQLNLSLTQEINQDVVELLKSLGISVEQASNKYFITQIPAVMQHRNYVTYIKEVIDQVADNQMGTALDVATHRTLSFLACRSAIKAGEPLTAEEQKNLVEKLLDTTTSYTCPHGRPVMLHLSHDQLAHWFKRTGF